MSEVSHLRFSRMNLMGGKFEWKKWRAVAFFMSVKFSNFSRMPIFFLIGTMNFGSDKCMILKCQDMAHRDINSIRSRLNG